MMTNDNNIVSKFKVTIRILFIFGRIVKTPYSVQPYILHISANVTIWHQHLTTNEMDLDPQHRGKKTSAAAWQELV